MDIHKFCKKFLFVFHSILETISFIECNMKDHIDDVGKKELSLGDEDEKDEMKTKWTDQDQKDVKDFIEKEQKSMNDSMSQNINNNKKNNGNTNINDNNNNININQDDNDFFLPKELFDSNSMFQAINDEHNNKSNTIINKDNDGNTSINEDNDDININQINEEYFLPK